MKNTFKNHIYFVFDRSGSMHSLISKAVGVFNKQIDALRNNSLEFEQETRVSFYCFNDKTECVINDVDVTRPIKLDEIKAAGQTALIDAVCDAISDSKMQPQKYGDHAFYIYIITDGEENSSSRSNLTNFKSIVGDLPDNYTLIAFVPDDNSKKTLVKFGIPEGNVDKWSVTEAGLKEVDIKLQAITRNVFSSRASGQRSLRTAFSDLTEVNQSNVSEILSEVPQKDYNILINEGVKAVEIRDLIESKIPKYTYRKGDAFYELVKNEHIQPQKQIMIQNKKNGKVYSGSNARKLLNLPNQEVKITVGDFGEWNVYVQSTSVNRRVIPKQRVLVVK
jgi:uncharacterized protein YegL